MSTASASSRNSVIQQHRTVKIYCPPGYREISQLVGNIRISLSRIPITRAKNKKRKKEEKEKRERERERGKKELEHVGKYSPSRISKRKR